MILLRFEKNLRLKTNLYLKVYSIYQKKICLYEKLTIPHATGVMKYSLDSCFGLDPDDSTSSQSKHKSLKRMLDLNKFITFAASS